MKSLWIKHPTPSPISIGQFASTDDGFALFKNGAYYAQPNSLASPALGVPALSLEFGFGQSLTLDFGGFHSIAPPGAP